MKKIFFLFVILFSFTCFAQSPMLSKSEEPVSFVSTLASIFIPAIIAQALVLFADAKKWYMSGSWSWQLFFSTKIIPFLLTTIGGIVLYLILTFVPFTKPFIEIFIGSPILELTSAALFGAAASIIDGFTKQSKT